MNKSLFKTLTFMLGGTFIFVAGISFMIVADLKLKCTSFWLFLCAFICFSATIFFFFGESFRDDEKKAKYYIIKSIGIIMTFAYIIYLIIFMNSKFFSEIDPYKSGQNTKYIISICSMVLSLLGFGLQLTNIIVFKPDRD